MLDQLYAGDFKLILSDRVGGKLTSGGDSEICYAAVLGGWRIWYEPRLFLRHFLPSKRLNWKYLRRLHRSFGESNAVLAVYRKLITCIGESSSKSSWVFDAANMLRSLLESQGVILYKFGLLCEGERRILEAEGKVGYILNTCRLRKRLVAAKNQVERTAWASAYLEQRRRREQKQSLPNTL